MKTFRENLEEILYELKDSLRLRSTVLEHNKAEQQVIQAIEQLVRKMIPERLPLRDKEDMLNNTYFYNKGYNQAIAKFEANLLREIDGEK